MSTCVYCGEEDQHTICLYCDGKHMARHVEKRLHTEKMIFNEKFEFKRFNEQVVIDHIKKQDILGLEGLKKEESEKFWAGYKYEWQKTKFAQDGKS
jgi:hypothetical protein